MPPKSSRKQPVEDPVDEVITLDDEVPTEGVVDLADEGVEVEGGETQKGQKGRGVTFVLDSDEEEEDEFDDDDEEDDDDDEEDDLTAAVSQLSQLLVTEDGEALADIMRGILDALDKHNKIMYRGLQVLETTMAKPGRR